MGHLPRHWRGVCQCPMYNLPVSQTWSINKVPIRLPAERWLHITEEHSELAGYYYDVLDGVANPDAVFMGTSSELLASKAIGIEKHLIIVYKELDENDGFIITAFITSRIKQIERRIKIWPL